MATTASHSTPTAPQSSSRTCTVTDPTASPLAHSDNTKAKSTLSRTCWSIISPCSTRLMTTYQSLARSLLGRIPEVLNVIPTVALLFVHGYEAPLR